jgi:iron complex outermembrane receptor protein
MVSGLSADISARDGEHQHHGLRELRARCARQMCASAIALCVALQARALPAQTQDSIPSPTELKRLSVEQLMQINVTSVSRQPEKLSEAASAIQVITHEEIRRSGATSIPEALRLAPNLQVAQFGAHTWAVTARGFNSVTANKLLVLVDGRTVYSPLFSGVFWDVQDVLLEDVDRIEVISGPGGAVWGANAVNGVINIITKSAKDTQGGYAEAGGGSSPNGFGAARYGGTTSASTSFRAYGQFYDRDNELLANDQNAGDAWRMGHGGVRFDAQPSGRDEVMVKGDAYGGNEGGNVQNVSDGTATVRGGSVTTRWTRTISESSAATLQLYYDHTQLSQPEPADDFAPSGRLKDRLDSYDLDFQHQFALGTRHHIVWGLAYRFTHDAVDNSPTLGFFPEHLDHSLVSGFAQDEISLLQTLVLTLGTKLEHDDYTGLEVEPTARLRWSFAPTQMVWGAVSRAVRTPSRVERDVAEPTQPPIVVAGNIDFESEILVAYELGYRINAGSKFSASLAAFYNSYDDIRSVSFTPATIIPLFFENNMAGETHGLELSATWQATRWWRLRAGLDVLKERLHVISGEIDLEKALNETSDPERQFSLQSSFDLPHHLELDVNPRSVDKLYNNIGNGVLGTVPSYTEMDARLGWNPPGHFGFSIAGQNLLHKHHPEFGIEGPTRGEIRRSVYGKLTWRF